MRHGSLALVVVALLLVVLWRFAYRSSTTTQLLHVSSSDAAAGTPNEVPSLSEATTHDESDASRRPAVAFLGSGADGLPQVQHNVPHEVLHSSLTIQTRYVGSIADVAPDPTRFSARWLPHGVPLFCPSYDNDTAMDHAFVGPLRGDGPPMRDLVVVLPERFCPSPIRLLVVDGNPEDLLAAPPKLSRRALRKMLLRGSRSGTSRPALEPNLTSIPVLYTLKVRLVMRVVERISAGAAPHVDDHNQRPQATPYADDASGAAPNTTTTTRTHGCLVACLASPCCTAFQLLRNATQWTCLVFTPRHDESLDDAPGIVHGVPVYFLAQRREFRPSLVDDALRLVITRGPAPIETLDPLCNGCLRKPLEVRLHGKFGVLQHRGYFGTVTLRVVVPDRNETTLGRVVKLSMRDGVATGDASQFFALVSAAGRKVCVEAALDGHLQDAGGSSLMGIEPRAARVCTVVGLPPARTVLRFGGPESGFDNESYVTRDPDTCAPYLRPTECCIRGFWYRIEDAEGRRTVPGYTHDLYTAHYATMGQPTAPRVTLTSLIQHPCVRLVDGYHSIAIPTGEGSFPVLVVDVVCDARLRDNMWQHGLPMQLETQFGSAPTAYGHLPWHVVSECMRRSALDTNTSQSYASSRRANATKSHLNGDGTPRRAIVGFSIRAHRELPFLAFQLKTIHAFAAQSVVALHLSSQWKLTATEMEAVALLNTSHPRTFVNPIRVRASSWKATHVHAANFAFLLASPLGVSHVVIWAANELLVRVGIVEYVQRYDMSAVDGMDPHDGLAYAHSLHHIAWWTPEQHRLGHHALWWWMPWDGVSGELLYSGIVRDRAAKFEASGDAAASEAFRRFPTHQLMLEGMFFNREMAQEFVYVAQETPLGEYCTTSGQYSDNEIFPFLTMRKRCGVTPGLRCGGRVSTMLWRDFLYLATQPALEETRCSAFANPFGWKRVRRTMEDPAVLALEQAMLDPERVHRPRDDVHHCPRTWSAISREKERLMPLML